MSRSGAPTLVHPTAHLGGAGMSRLMAAAVFAVAMTVALAVVLHFHDRFWAAPEEGAYAHVAERVLAGESLAHAERAVHLGYTSFANALAFKLFGVDLVSLRYPLVALTLLLCALTFWLLAGRGLLAAFSGAFAMACLTFVQYLNPAAQWYALFLCVLIVAVLAARPTERRGTLELAGFLLAALFLFHPLSGVFAAMGVFAFLLLQEERHPGHPKVRLARGLALLMLVGLVLYLRAMTDLAAALLFGAPPALLLGFTFVTTRVGDRALAVTLLRLLVGGALAAAPLLAYHLAAASFDSWWQETLASMISPSAAGTAEAPGFAALAVQGGRQVVGGFAGGAGGAALLNGLLWLVLPLLPLVLGVTLLRGLWREQGAGTAALPIVACFFALVSVDIQAPANLFFSSALTVAAVLFLAAGAGARRSFACASFALVLSLIGLTYQAGQPLARGWQGIVAGETRTVVAPSGLPRAGLTVAAEEAALYGLLVELVEANTTPEDTILALPASPEIHYLAQRRYPLPFFDAARGLGTVAELQAAQAALAQAPPRLVFFRPHDSDNTPLVWRLMADLRDRYRLLETAGGFEIYLLKESAARAH